MIIYHVHFWHHHHSLDKPLWKSVSQLVLPSFFSNLQRNSRSRNLPTLTPLLILFSTEFDNFCDLILYRMIHQYISLLLYIKFLICIMLLVDPAHSQNIFFLCCNYGTILIHNFRCKASPSLWKENEIIQMKRGNAIFLSYSWN